MSLEDNLDRVVARFEELGHFLANPETAGSNDFARISKEYSDLTPVVECINELRGMRDELADLEAMRDDPDTDGDMRELAEAESADIRDRLPELEMKLKLLLLPKDEADAKNAILELRAGTGGEEAALFASSLFRMYQRYAEVRGWKFELMHLNETGIGGYKEAVVSVTGRDVFARLKFESGVHRVQRVPETESGGRIHTSAATVAVLPEAEEVDIAIADKDLRIDVFRASGPGGQSVNTTDSAVRITHLPTGIVVSQQDEKSQHKNKAKAMRVLRARLYEHERSIVDAERSAARRTQVGSGDRSERIRTYNFPQGRVTDHRINLTLHKLDRVMDGELDEIVDALTAEDQAARLAEVGVKPEPTYGELVDQAARRLKSAGIDGARLDARVLVGEVAGLDAAALLSRSRDPASADTVERIGQLVGRRERHEPLAQILGIREFWSLSFRVTPDTLIPRPDSETLVAAALDWAGQKDRPLRILDLGCGTGCLLISLLTEWPRATGVGVDIDPAALWVAGDNARRLGCGKRAEFACADWGDGIAGTFDVVISNPPYVPDADVDGLEPDVRQFEPRLALSGGADGLDAYRALSQAIGPFLAPGGGAFLEIGFGQASQVAGIMADGGFEIFGENRDLAGVVRCLAMRRKAPVGC